MTDRIPSGGGDAALEPLTLERMRRDVAEALYLEPEEVGDEDDLIDLGLDSVRLMSLAVRWNEAGAGFAFVDLAERPALLPWWQLAQRAGTGG